MSENQVIIPSSHSNSLDQLVEIGGDIDVTLADLSAGVVTKERHRYSGGAGQLEIVTKVNSYRQMDGMIDFEGEAEWVNVAANTTLSRLLKEYGNRLLGYDKTSRTYVLQLLSFDVVDASKSTVRVLVRKK